MDFQLNSMSLESGGKIATVFLNRIGGLVFAAEQGDARNGQGRELPGRKSSRNVREICGARIK